MVSHFDLKFLFFILFFFFLLVCFPPNLNEMSIKKDLRQDISMIETRYEGSYNPNMMGGYY